MICVYKKIWLVNSNGEITSWGDRPDSSDNIDDKDITEYIRADIVESLREQLSQANAQIEKLEVSLGKASLDIRELCAFETPLEGIVSDEWKVPADITQDPGWSEQHLAIDGGELQLFGNSGGSFMAVYESENITHNFGYTKSIEFDEAKGEALKMYKKMRAM